jgi:hypothetical protein
VIQDAVDREVGGAARVIERDALHLEIGADVMAPDPFGEGVVTDVILPRRGGRPAYVVQTALGRHVFQRRELNVISP